MHFQEVTASLLLSERRGHCKQFEITQPKGHEKILIQEQVSSSNIFSKPSMMLRRTTTKCSLIYGVKQDCLMGNTFNAGLSTDKAREAGMTG
jgi:hypothetical protein